MNREKIPVDCDISVTAIIDAEKTIREKINKDFKHKVNYTIKIPSQRLGEIYPIAYAVGHRVELDMTYHEDEWSIIGSYWDFTDKPAMISHELWSPGA